MKNKKVTYLLIVAVAAIWGIIFFRVFNAVASKEEHSESFRPDSKPHYFTLVDHALDVVKLNFNYRDPFQVSAVEEENYTASPKLPVTSNKMPSTPMFKPQVNWPTVLYTGYIINPNSKKRIAIISVNGASAMLGEKEQAFGIRLDHLTADSIQLSYQLQKKSIRLNQL